MFDKNNPTVTLNILYIKKKKKYVQLLFQNLIQTVKTNNYLKDPKRGKGKLTLSCSKKIISLLRGITSKHDGDFYCLNCLYSFRP